MAFENGNFQNTCVAIIDRKSISLQDPCSGTFLESQSAVNKISFNCQFRCTLIGNRKMQKLNIMRN